MWTSVGINHRVAVRMVIAAWCRRQILAHLRCWRPGKSDELVHRVKDAALGRLQAVAGIGQRAGDDDRHRVIEEGVLDLVGDVDFLDFFVGGEERGGADGCLLFAFAWVSLVRGVGISSGMVKLFCGLRGGGLEARDDLVEFLEAFFAAAFDIDGFHPAGARRLYHRAK